MFGKSRQSKAATREKSGKPTRAPSADVPVWFGIMFILSILELGFTVDSFQYLQKTHSWASKTERARLGFLIFSSVRTIALSAAYTGFHFAKKHLHSMFHTVFVVLSTIFWVVSGVLIHQMWGVILCKQGVTNLEHKLTECHELKIIEIIAWVLAGVSVIATISVLLNAMKGRKARPEQKTSVSG